MAKSKYIPIETEYESYKKIRKPMPRPTTRNKDRKKDRNKNNKHDDF